MHRLCCMHGSALHKRMLYRFLDSHTHIPSSLGASISPPPTLRLALRFPVRPAGLVLITIFTLSVVFSCCYHWHKIWTGCLSVARIRSLASFSTAEGHLDLHTTKSHYREEAPSLPVVMPGENVPKFLACPCPKAPAGVKESKRLPTNV
eukprot:c43688_g1_i1 orf=405-851(-)